MIILQKKWLIGDRLKITMVKWGQTLFSHKNIIKKGKVIKMKQSNKEMEKLEVDWKKEDDGFLEKLFKEYKPIKDNLIQMLNEVQEHYGYVPMYAQKALSEFLSISMAEIYGVVTFYSRFSLKPKGKYNISVCLGTACFVKGSQKIMDRLLERLKIQVGETTSDGKFSIEETRCVGACGLAPVFTVNGEVYGKATVKKLDEVLDELMNE